MAQVIYCKPGDTISNEQIGSPGDYDFLARNSFQARAYADGEDVHEGVLFVPNDQTTFVPPHPLRNCLQFQWYYDNHKGQGLAPIEGETDDTYAIDTSSISKSGDYWCRMTFGQNETETGVPCIVQDSPRIRLIVVDCDYDSQNGGVVATQPYEGGMFQVSVRHPGFISPHTELTTKADEWLSPTGSISVVESAGNNSTVTCDVVNTVFDVEANPGPIDMLDPEYGKALQDYISLNVGSFECKHAVTRDYPLDGTGVMSTATDNGGAALGSSVEIDPENAANFSVSPGNSITSGAILKITPTMGNTVDYSNEEVIWTVSQGTVTSNTFVTPGNDFASSFAIVTPPNDGFTGTATLTASHGDSSDSVSIEWSATPMTTTTVIDPSYLGAQVTNVPNVLAPVPTTSTTGSFSISGSPAEAVIFIWRVGYTGQFTTVGNGTTSGTLVITGPSGQTIPLSISGSDSTATEEVKRTLDPGNYTYELDIDPNSDNVGLITFNLYPTVYPPFNFNF